MLAALTWFVLGSVPTVESANFDRFFADGVGGLLAATGLVFVSYAGVTKVASIAEEVEDRTGTSRSGSSGRSASRRCCTSSSSPSSSA